MPGSAPVNSSVMRFASVSWMKRQMLRVGVLLPLLLLAPNLQAQSLISAQDYYENSVARLKKGDGDGAINDLTKAIELNPNYVDALFARGQARFFLKKDWDRALTDYDKVLVLAPGYVKTRESCSSSAKSFLSTSFHPLPRAC